MKAKHLEARLGKAIREQRERLGLSQEQLAQEADLHRTYVGSVERGERNVSLVNIVQIANALKLTGEDLLRLSGL